LGQLSSVGSDASTSPEGTSDAAAGTPADPTDPAGTPSAAASNSSVMAWLMAEPSAAGAVLPARLAPVLELL
jgi:hypothetical protein